MNPAEDQDQEPRMHWEGAHYSIILGCAIIDNSGACIQKAVEAIIA